jgi:hypothetical protein
MRVSPGGGELPSSHFGNKVFAHVQTPPYGLSVIWIELVKAGHSQLANHTKNPNSIDTYNRDENDKNYNGSSITHVVCLRFCR